MDELSRFFDLLELRPGASLEEIRQAYRDLAQIWHPDRYEHNPRLRAKAEEKLKDLNEAYQRLSTYTKPTQEAPPPPKSSSPPNETRAAAEHTSKTNYAEKTKATPSNNCGCITASIIAIVVIIVIVANQGSEPKPTPQPYQLPATPPNDPKGFVAPDSDLDIEPSAPSGLKMLSQMKAQIETRVAAKNVEFDRLEKWYQNGVATKDESDYRRSLEAAQKEESEIESLILTYNSKKKDIATERSNIPETQTSWPQRGGFLCDIFPGNSGLGKINVENGASYNAICKIIDTSTNKKICSFLVMAKTNAVISGLPDGSFRILVAYGNLILEGTDSFQKPIGFSQFKDVFEFTTTYRSGGDQYSTYSIALHKALADNDEPSEINQDYYNKY